MSAHPTPSHLRRTFIQGVISGIGWAVGATIGFAVLLAILGTIFSLLLRIPVIRNLIQPVADIVQGTEDPRQQVIERLDK